MDTSKGNSSDAPGHTKFTIIINGRRKDVSAPELSFEDIINLAYDNNPPSGPNVVITVTYRAGVKGAQGSLLPGDKVTIKDGMNFNVKATDRS